MIRWVLLLLCVLLAPVAHAVDYEVVPWSVQSASKSASGAATRITYAARPKAAGMPTLYRTSSVVLPPSSAGNLVRWAMRRAPYAIWAVAFYEYAKSNGYMFVPDAPNGDMATPGADGYNVPEGYVFEHWTCWSGGPVSSPNECFQRYWQYWSNMYPYAVACSGIQFSWDSSTMTYGWVHTGCGGGGNGSIMICRRLSDNAVVRCPSSGTSETKPSVPASPDMSMPTDWNDSPSTVDAGGTPGNASSSDYWDQFNQWPSGDESAMKDAFSDPVSSRPYSTPEIEAEAERIRDQLIQESGDDPASYPDQPTAPSVDPNDASAPGLSEDPIVSTPEQPGGGTAQQPVELPAFCEYAQTLCDWLGWTQEPLEPLADAPDLPVVETAPATWDSGLGSGACPAPIVVSALGASVSLSWQPACDFVTMLRPILIAFAGIAAALILLGQRAGGAG